MTRILKTSSTANIIYLILIVILPLLSLNRNPDLHHDSWFFTQGLAVQEGLQIYEDIYSFYGPLVPWIFALAIAFVGEYVIVGRVLGLVVLWLICITMYYLVRKKLSSRNALLLVCLFVSVSPERTELDSPRWIYGGGIWPISLSVFLTLVSIVVVYELCNSDQTKIVNIRLFVLSLLLPLLAIVRLQSLLLLLLLIPLIIMINLHGSESIQRKSKFVGLGLGISFTTLLVHLFRSDTFLLTVSGIVVNPFKLAEDWMQGKWLSWLFSFSLFAVVSSISFAILLSVVRVLSQKLERKILLPILTSLVTFGFFYSGTYNYPSEFNKSPLLWTLKIISKFPSWYMWPIMFCFLLLVCKTLFNFVKFLRESKSSGDFASSVNSWEKAAYITIGLVSLTHLFWNFSYISGIFPIFVTLTLLLNPILPKDKSFTIAFWNILRIGISTFALVATIGFFQDSKPHSTKMLWGLFDTRPNYMNIDRAIEFVESENLNNSSQFFCNIPIYRAFDLHSYKLDNMFELDPPLDFIDYLQRLPSSTSMVLVCSDSEMLIPHSLTNFGWFIHSSKTFLPEDVSIKILKRMGT